MKRTQNPLEPSQRQLRVGEEIRHVLSMVLTKDLLLDELPYKGMVTITEVQMSPDLKNARAFIMTLDGEKLREIANALNEHAKRYRHEVAQQISLKFMPKISFKPDLSYLKAQKLEAIFRSPHVAQDLAAQRPDQEDARTTEEERSDSSFENVR